MRRSVFTVTFLASMFAVAGLTPATAAAADPLSIEIVELCPPQIAGCLDPSEPCAAVSQPGRHIGAVLRVTRGGEPVEWARVAVTSAAQDSTWFTDADGRARVRFAPADAVSVEATQSGDAAAVAPGLFWGVVDVSSPTEPLAARVGTTASVPLAVALDGMGAGAAVPITVTLADADGATTSHVGTSDGVAATLGADGPGDLSYDVVDVAACGLALGDATGFSIGWWLATPPTVELFDASDPDVTTTDSTTVEIAISNDDRATAWFVSNDDVLPAEPDWLDARPTEFVIPAVEGPHVVHVWTRYADGGHVDTPGTATIELDRSAPTLVVEGPAPGASYYSGIPVWGSVADATTPVVVQAVVDGRLPIEVPVDGDGAFGVRLDASAGAHELVLRAIDAHGRSTTTEPVAVTVRARSVGSSGGPSSTVQVSDGAERAGDQDPTPRIALPARTGWVTSAPFDVPVRSNVAFEWRLDDGPWRAPPVLVPEGEHDVLVRALNDAETVVGETYRVDATRPDLAVTTEVAPVGGFLPAASALNVDAADGGSGLETVRARVDGGPWTTPADLFVDGDGDHVVEVEAIDVAGHSTARVLELRVDATAPVLEAPTELPSDATELTVTATDATSGVVQATVVLPSGATLGGEPIDGTTWTFALPDIVEVGTAITVRVDDAAGNTAGATVPVVEPPATDVDLEAADEPDEGIEPTALDDGVAQRTFAIESVVVSPSAAGEGQPIRLSASAQGIAGGRLVLVDADGARVELADIVVDGTTLRAEGRAPGPGTYQVILELETTSGNPLVHEDGTVTVAGNDGSGNAVPLPGVVAVLALATCGVLARPRRR